MSAVVGLAVTALLVVAFIFFGWAALRARAGYGWLVPAGLACWAFLAVLSRLAA